MNRSRIETIIVIVLLLVAVVLLSLNFTSDERDHEEDRTEVPEMKTDTPSNSLVDASGSLPTTL
ncbi:hypothetical protein [Geomicrobium sp. JCM 19039]|uniref:hypothetical protein n=1 Tax=Geomicrobium sp. JCM 19039 TaxID=1460636 RepID=UPI00045F2904|nr:hypothetical protein [Geomicrobium sp. JCM 19039]GAK14102.1 hypothetical protein JCM19039_3998 [Geomicrobium sp. JCM 19039]